MIPLIAVMVRQYSCCDKVLKKLIIGDF